MTEIEPATRVSGPDDAPRNLVARFPGAVVLGEESAIWQDALLRRLLAVADLLTVGAVALALVTVAHAPTSTVVWMLFFAPAWVLLAKLHGLYDHDHRALRYLTADELPRIMLWAVAGTIGGLGLLLIATPTRPFVPMQAAVAFATATAVGAALRTLARSTWRRVTPPQRTMIVGDESSTHAARRKLELFPDIHVQVVAERLVFAPDELASSPHVLDGIDRVLVAASFVDEETVAELLAVCRRDRVKLTVVPPMRGMFGTAVTLSHIADLPVVEYNTWDVSRSTLFLKRVMDIVGASVLLIVLAPLFVGAAVAIKLESRGPVLFGQVRAGENRRRFRIFKFRTMVINAESLLDDLVPFDTLHDPMFKLRNDPRVTRVGRFLRRTSLDELPQLANVLRGDMSLVGPRPEQVELVDRYEPAHLFRLSVRPGLTGPMQVYGRGQLSFEERLAVEREYIENLSVARDFRILTLTLAAVFGGRGAY
jgi:exopolysaccharide biosynthesis polyprenyl glycosylphosphotransferase